MTEDERSTQMFRAISMSNRLSVARIKLQRADKLSDGFSNEITQIDRNIFSFTDCFIIGDDVNSDLDIIERQIGVIESKV